MKIYGKGRRKVAWIVKWKGKYGRKLSWIVKRLENTEEHSEIIWKIWKKRGKDIKNKEENSEKIGKIQKKLWKDMENMEERQVEKSNDMEIMEEK